MIPLPGDLVRLLPGTRQAWVAEVYWIDGEHVEVTTAGGQVWRAPRGLVRVVVPRPEVGR